MNKNYRSLFIEHDYYPFGMVMPERNFSNDIYRFGFNGFEKDDEVSGSGNHMSFADFGLDTRLGRRWNNDPLTSKFPFQSPYSVFNNNSILYADPTGKSGEVGINKETKTITVRSDIFLYGNAASPELAIQTANDIQTSWNGAKGKVTIDGIEYSVNFEIHGYFIPDLKMPITNTSLLVKGLIKSNKSFVNNYFRVETVTTDEDNTSFADGIGSNTGYFKLSQINGSATTTEGHEYGHGMGSDHDDYYAPDPQYPIEIQDVNPGIMIPMGGTSPDPDYNYGGKPNGEIDISKRKVLQQNIDELGLDKLQYDSNGKATIGNLSNKYHPK